MSQKRKITIVNESIYHVYNRSIAKEDIFIDARALGRFCSLLDFYRYRQRLRYSQYKKLSKAAKQNYWEEIKKSEPITEIYAFAIMPTHYHLLLKQKSERGIPFFVSNFQNGYAKYFNKRNERDGGLFKRPFKASYIPNDEIFLHVMRYIHLNPVTSNMVTFKELKDYPWNSFSIYYRKSISSFIHKDFVLNYFKNVNEFMSFVANQKDYQKQLAKIKSLILEKI